MAIQNARILMRGGNEADFDPDKMQPKEWAVSLDQRIVRICVAPGVCIRMATYDAFEADMAQIEAILEQTKSIQEAVTLINEQVSVNAEAVAEYTEEAKQYRDEAEQFRNEAEAFSPEGYSELVQNVEENTVKIDTILEKGGLTFDESASGENIHIFDSTDNKATAFALYGKATQESTTGKNLLENTATSQTKNGITFTVNEDKSVTVNGTSTSTYITSLSIGSVELDEGTYICTGCPMGGANDAYNIRIGKGASDQHAGNEYGDGLTLVLTEKTNVTLKLHIGIGSNANNITFYPMIRLATATDATYEPYTGGIASPNPDYPQEINVAGASGSVEVKSVGKNLLENTATSRTDRGVTFTVNENKSVTVNGVVTDAAEALLYFYINSNVIPDVFQKGVEYIGSVITSFGITNIQVFEYLDGAWKNICQTNKSQSFVISEKATGLLIRLQVYGEDRIVNNETVYAMIRLATDTDSTYEPYQETTATIPTPNGLPGIPVSSGGNYTDENGQMRIADVIYKYADGTGKYVQRVKKRVLNGSETYAQSSVTDDNRLCVYTGDEEIPNTANNAIICDTFIYGKYNAVDTLNIISAIGRNINIGVSKTIASTVEDFKTWLSNHPVTLYVELAEPIITDLSAEEIAEIEKLQTFYPVTNISNDAGCGMDIAYKADAKNYIDNIILARVATLETAVINNL